MSSSQKDMESFDPSRFDPMIKETEREMSVFFENVLNKLYNTANLNYFKFRKSLGNLRSRRNSDVSIHADIDFEEDYVRCAYIFAYSIIHSMAVYDRFSDMMKLNPSMMKRIASMKNLRLCTFGGGPAFEVVAICKLLCRVLAQMGSDEREPLEVHVTVIDICAKWESEAKSIISFVQSELATGNNITVSFSFLEADLTKDFAPNVIKAFRKAHFVTMLKFVSDVYETFGEERLLCMINKIIESMNYKSCLFLLDFSGGGVFRKTDRKIDEFPLILRIYGPSLHHCCEIGEDTVENFTDRMKYIFRRSRCTPQNTVSCSAWMKIRHFVKLKNQFPRIKDEVTVSGYVEENKLENKKPKIKVKKEMQSRLKLIEASSKPLFGLDISSPVTKAKKKQQMKAKKKQHSECQP